MSEFPPPSSPVSMPAAHRPSGPVVNGSGPAPGTGSARPLVSLVIPARDEAGNLPALLDEVDRALAGLDYECLVVDDASTDGTWALLVARAAVDPRLRPLRHERGAGQSTSVWQAARVARGEWLATMDGDGQNDPADIPALLARARQGDVTIVAGHRVTRRDDWLKRMSSRVANRVRSAVLGDETPDTGCGLKVLRREAFLSLPYFDHMHRFLPALVKAQGGRCVSVPVGHRPRQAGISHYTLNNRLWVGLVDMAGVLWLRRRTRLPAPLAEFDRASGSVVTVDGPAPEPAGTARGDGALGSAGAATASTSVPAGASTNMPVAASTNVPAGATTAAVGSDV